MYMSIYIRVCMCICYIVHIIVIIIRCESARCRIIFVLLPCFSMKIRTHIPTGSWCHVCPRPFQNQTMRLGWGSSSCLPVPVLGPP